MDLRLANAMSRLLKTYQVGRKLSSVSVRQRKDIVSYLELKLVKAPQLKKKSPTFCQEGDLPLQLLYIGCPRDVQVVKHAVTDQCLNYTEVVRLGWELFGAKEVVA
jgi:hypothetical protein